MRMWRGTCKKCSLCWGQCSSALTISGLSAAASTRKSSWLSIVLSPEVASWKVGRLCGCIWDPGSYVIAFNPSPAVDLGFSAEALRWLSSPPFARSTTENLSKKIVAIQKFNPAWRSQAKALWKDLRRPKLAWNWVSSSKPSGVCFAHVQQIQQVGTCSNGRASQVCATALLATRQLAPHFLEKSVAKNGNSTTKKISTVQTPTKLPT